MADRIPLLEPTLEGRVGDYLAECVESGFVSSVGRFVTRFEDEFAAWLGTGGAVACASGTAALHLALRTAGVQAGDEVWVSDLTFVASANPILYEHARPVLVDADPDEWNLDVVIVRDELIERDRQGRPQPTAIVAAHILGLASDLGELAATCRRFGVVLIEDAAESLGASVGDVPAGRQADIGCFSFNGNKIITAGGGGMLVARDPDSATRARHLSTQARLPGPHYLHDDVGYNYRLTNIAAAVGLAQLEILPSLLARKHAIARRYDDALAGIPGIERPPRPSGTTASDWLYTVLVDDRDDVMERLVQAGVDARPIWTPLHRMPMFADAARLGTGREADRLGARGLSLPSSAHLEPSDQDRVVEALIASVA